MLSGRKKAKTHLEIDKKLLACQQRLISLGGDVISLYSLASNVTSNLHGSKVK